MTYDFQPLGVPCQGYNFGHYPTVELAQVACAHDTSCAAVWDEGCDDRPRITLCGPPRTDQRVTLPGPHCMYFKRGPGNVTR